VRAGRRTVRLLAADNGSGSILGLAIVGATMMLTALVVPAFALLAVGQSVHNAADAAALAAADTASGAVGGVPCEAAAAAAAMNGASVEACEVARLVASVTVSRSVAGFDIVARARAGPPPK
jgi:secretion/DNA translocation related TadE-like protein